MATQKYSATYPDSMQDFEKNLKVVMNSRFAQQVKNFCDDMYWSILNEGGMADDYVNRHGAPLDPSDCGWVEINKPIDGEHYAIKVDFKITKIKKFSNAEYKEVMEEFNKEPKDLIVNPMDFDSDDEEE